MRQAITSGHRTSIGQAVAFQGLGGLGKTQLVIEYAYRFKDDYPNGVIWINADQDIEAQVSELAERARWVAPESEHRYKLDVARHRLKTYSGCLIVFDNLEDSEAIEEFLPEPQANPHILVTSRTEQPGFTPFPLGLLNPQQSLELLTLEAGRSPEGEAEEEAALQIAESLDGLPLALELAGGYLRHRESVAWVQYQEFLNQNLRAAMPGRFLTGSFTKHEADIYSTLKLNEEFFTDEPSLKEVVDLLTWSGSAPMGLSLMCQLLGMEDQTELTNALGLGVELRLLQKTPDEERYAIHRLVREVRREDVSLEGREPWVNAVCQRLGEWFQLRREDFADLLVFEAEIDHLRGWQVVASVYVPQFASRLTWLQAYPSYHQGRYREAKGWVENALALLGESQVDNKELEAHLLHDLSATYRDLGEYQPAMQFTRQALKIRQDMYGDKHPDTAKSLDSLAAMYRYTGDYQRGLEHAAMALKIRLGLLGENHMETASSLGTSANIYLAMGDYKRALEFAERALGIMKLLHGENHPGTAASLGIVGSAYAGLGHYPRALECHQQALEIKRQVLGEKHPDNAISFNQLAVIYGSQDDYERALEYFNASLESSRSLLGETHPDTGTALQNIGAIYANRGDHTLALNYKEKALEIRQKQLGPGHPVTIASVLSLSLSRYESGDAPKALNVLEGTLALLPREHPDYNRIFQRKLEVLGGMTGGGFRRQPQRGPAPKKKRRR